MQKATVNMYSFYTFLEKEKKEIEGKLADISNLICSKKDELISLTEQYIDFSKLFIDFSYYSAMRQIYVCEASCLHVRFIYMYLTYGA
mgnify:CR=1 FL=1